jgi:uncharacterized protein YidB (DUF937 family)
MSPIMMALLGLLAYKAIKGGGLETMLGRGNAGGGAQPPMPSGSGGSLADILGGALGGGNAGAPSGGGLGDILGGMLGGGSSGGRPGGTTPGGGGLADILGGMLGGGAAGSVLNGGLGQVINDMQRSGQGRTAQSWIGRGENEAIEPDDLGRALGADTIDQLSRDTGLGRDELLQGLSQNLPDFVDRLTPEGRLPTDEEASRW